MERKGEGEPVEVVGVVGSMENTPSNPCIGCGPANEVGMRLSFARSQEGAMATWVATAQWQGFPGRIHSGAFYLALIETMNWSLYAHTERMGLPTRTSALDLRRRAQVGDIINLKGRIVSNDDITRHVHADAEATTSAGEVIARLDRDYAMVDEATILAKMGYDALPEGYEGAFES